MTKNEGNQSPVDVSRWADWLAVILNPSYWLQNFPLCLQWDQELTWLLDNGYRFDVQGAGEYEAIIGPYTVWIANHPYSSFTYKRFRPRRVTILRAHRQWMADGGGQKFVSLLHPKGFTESRP